MNTLQLKQVMNLKVEFVREVKLFQPLVPPEYWKTLR